MALHNLSSLLQPILDLLTSRPQLLAEHTQAYVELVASAVSKVADQWQRRIVLQLLALGSLCVGLVLAGMALMLWAVRPVDDVPMAWILLATPLVPLMAAVILGWLAHGRDRGDALATVKQQVRSDLQMLREVRGA